MKTNIATQVSLDKKRIAIIEDDDAIQSLIKTSLEMAFNNETEILRFKNAREAIFEIWEREITDNMEIDLLFLDIFLDDKTNGLDILEYCQFIPEDVTVVLMTSNFSEEQLDRILHLNIEPILLKKPFTPRDIVYLTEWCFRIHQI